MRFKVTVHFTFGYLKFEVEGGWYLKGRTEKGIQKMLSPAYPEAMLIHVERVED